MSTTAKLFVDDLPELGDGVRRYVVDCKWSTTRLLYAPGELDLAERHLKTIALQKHEDECGKCNLGRLWREHADLAIKAVVDRVWDQLGGYQVDQRRN